MSLTQEARLLPRDRADLVPPGAILPVMGSEIQSGVDWRIAHQVATNRAQPGDPSFALPW